MGRGLSSFPPLDFWKWESKEVILLSNLEENIPKVRALPWRKRSHKASQQWVAKRKQHLQDALKLNYNILELLIPRWGWEAAIFFLALFIYFTLQYCIGFAIHWLESAIIFKDQRISLLFRERLKFLRLGLFIFFLLFSRFIFNLVIIAYEK